MYAQEVDSIVDIRDGQIYKTVKIGEQWWLKENLNIGTRIDGGQDVIDNGIIEKYCYDNSDSMCNIYGGLYQWNEVMDYNLSDNGNLGVTQGICPIGWHLSTDSEWTELAYFLGGLAVTGGKLKETDTTHWQSPNTGATNESGFTALPGGGGNYIGTFYLIGKFGFWWSSTEDNPNGARFWNLIDRDRSISSNSEYKRNYFSVRCVRNSQHFGFLTITDTLINPITALNFSYDQTHVILLINSAAEKTICISDIYTLKSVYSINKSSSVLSPGESLKIHVSFNPPKSGKFTDSLYIESDDPYNPVFYIPLSGYMQEIDSIIDIRDGQMYMIVKIGEQWWMRENLNIGKRIDGGQDAIDNGTIEKYCYKNRDSLCNIYGGLYQWNEMMDYNPSDNGNPGITQGICPVGWHIPTDIEWIEVTDFLGGEAVAGDKLKETGIIHWIGPNTGATNETGFTALPSGIYNNYDDSFSFMKIAGFWWSSTTLNTGNAWNRVMPFNISNLNKVGNSQKSGFSIRCLKDE